MRTIAPCRIPEDVDRRHAEGRTEYKASQTGRPTEGSSMEQATSPRILVIRPDRVGDVVLSLPVINALRHRWPEAYLAMMVHPYTRGVAERNPCLDDVIADDPDDSHRGLAGFLKQVQRLRSRRFDSALMLMPTMRHAWMLFLAGIPRRVGVGRTIYQALTFTRSISRGGYEPLRHESDYCLDLARAFDAREPFRGTLIEVEEQERLEARTILDSPEGVPVIGIHPGNGGNAPNWTAERYGALARRLQDRHGAKIVVTGSATEGHLARTILSFLDGPALSLAGRLSLGELIAVIGEMDLLVSSSTGPMHLAGALGVPTVSIFCPLPARSPQRWRPLGGQDTNLLPPDGQCPTCERGPLCDLSGINVEMTGEAVGRQLG